MDTKVVATTPAPTLGQPPAAPVLAERVRHALDDTLDRWDAGERTPDTAKSVAELALAHRALDS